MFHSLSADRTYKLKMRTVEMHVSSEKSLRQSQLEYSFSKVILLFLVLQTALCDTRDDRKHITEDTKAAQMI